ncbi:MAG: phage GP46 family protein, partial [Synergistaceae bacterium]
MLGGDIKVKWSAAEQAADFVLDDGDIDLSSDEGLETAIVISLFTDRRAEGEELPSGETRLKGWWGDSLAEPVNDRIGSKLWLLYREKQLPEVAHRAKQYVEEALKWLTETKIAQKVEVETTFVQTGLLGIGVKIYKPALNEVTDYRFNYNWQAQ